MQEDGQCLCWKAPNSHAGKFSGGTIRSMRENYQGESNPLDALYDNDELGEEPSREVARQLELFEPEEIARPDYNVGKYATFLFASPHRKNLQDHQSFTWMMSVPEEDGNFEASIRVSPQKDLTVPTTTTFKVWMALIQLWRMQGSPPNGRVYFSDRQLAEVAGWSFSGVTAKKIKTHIQILQGTTIDWKLSYKLGEKTEARVKSMSLINDAMTVTRSEMFKSERFTAAQSVTLHDMLVQNMLNNIVRPINFESLRRIKSDASTRLYMLLDMFLVNKPVWQRRSKNLLMIDLGYEGRRYENRGERKRTLERLIKDLDGKELTNGKLALTMEKTSDGSDWKLVARKAKRIEKKRPHLPTVRSEGEAEFLADELIERLGIGSPKRGFMVFLCRHYPESVLRDAVSRAKSDYLGNVRKSIGAIFRYELKSTVDGRGDLRWYKDEVSK